jgi:hypothetical protein
MSRVVCTTVADCPTDATYTCPNNPVVSTTDGLFKTCRTAAGDAGAAEGGSSEAGGAEGGSSGGGDAGPG